LEVRDGSFFTGNNAKTMTAFNTGSVLERLAKVSVATWKDGEVNRISPNLKELSAAFGLNNASLLDLEGINLAAIKALQERLQQRETELRDLQTRNAALQQRLADFEARMKALETRLSPRR
jgi:septal ring factor EnvC (AmiA/AmiB activator)